jgi:hypothetical protein
MKSYGKCHVLYNPFTNETFNLLKTDIQVNCTQKFSFYTRTKSVSTRKTNHLMLFWEITNIYCRKRTKETKTHCGNNGESLNVTVGGTHICHWVLNG